MKKHCDCCKIEYNPYRKWQRFCSEECRREWNHGGGNGSDELVGRLGRLSNAELRSVLRRVLRAKTQAPGRLRVRY